MYDIIELNKKLVNELREIAKGLEVKKTDKLTQNIEPVTESYPGHDSPA